MNSYYYANASNETVGPHTLDEIKNFAFQGAINNSTPIIEHGSATWTNLPTLLAEQQTSEMAAAMVNQARKLQGQMQSSMGDLSLGSALFGLLLVLLHLVLLPISILKKSFLDLSSWGKSSRLPTSGSEHPVLTFSFVVLRSPVILLLFLGSFGIIIHYLCTGLIDPFADASNGYMPVEMSFRYRPTIEMSVSAYFFVIVVALIFDACALFLAMANSLKKISENR